MKRRAWIFIATAACLTVFACTAPPVPDFNPGRGGTRADGTPSSDEKTAPRPSDVTPPSDGPSTEGTPPPASDPTEQAAQITSVSPDSVTLGEAPQGIDVTLTGSRFSTGSRFDIAGTLVDAQASSPTTLTVRVPANAIAAAGVMQVSVVSATNLRSNTLTFTVANPSAVSITALNPANAIVNTQTEQIVALTGSGFVPSSVVKFNGTTLTSTFQSATQISARIPTSILTTAGRFSVTVESGQNVVSLPSTFEVRNPRPTLTTVAPSSIASGSGATVITLDGNGFVRGSEVSSGTTPLATTFVSATRVRATLPTNFLTTAGTLRLAVKSPTPGGGTSTTASFTVTGAAAGGAACEYKCADYNYALNECYKDWFCDAKDGCLYQKQCGGQQAANCLYKCTDYNYKPGQCYQGWICLDSGQYQGCLGQTTCP